ncbi:hypothetical protein F4778DRAFT_756187 [Xylariomycetidae sp. FL2044]|nr:hypothetical protein F4778DRAFT_756187 [Xylariomycetidae sp. FL2044]
MLHQLCTCGQSIGMILVQVWDQIRGSKTLNIALNIHKASGVIGKPVRIDAKTSLHFAQPDFERYGVLSLIVIPGRDIDASGTLRGRREIISSLVALIVTNRGSRQVRAALISTISGDAIITKACQGDRRIGSAGASHSLNGHLIGFYQLILTLLKLNFEVVNVILKNSIDLFKGSANQVLLTMNGFKPIGSVLEGIIAHATKLDQSVGRKMIGLQ